MIFIEQPCSFDQFNSDDDEAFLKIIENENDNVPEVKNSDIDSEDEIEKED